MDIVPIRSRIPEHLKKLGKSQQWLADQLGMSKQQLSDCVNMRYILGMQAGMNIANLLKVSNLADLYVWERRGE